MVSALPLRSGDPGFETRSDHSLKFDPGCLWFKFLAALVNGQLVCLRPVGITNSCCCCCCCCCCCMSVCTVQMQGNSSCPLSFDWVSNNKPITVQFRQHISVFHRILFFPTADSSPFPALWNHGRPRCGGCRC